MASTKSKSKDSAKQKRTFFTSYNVIGIVLCILLLPWFIFSVTLWVSSLIHRDAPPSCFGYTPLMVESGSMAPLFDENDLIFIKNTGDNATYKVGDIICFHSGDVYVTHRIKEITTDADGAAAYITQGDANNAPDQGAVLKEQIVGIYSSHLNGMGKAFMFIHSPTGLIVCVMLPAILVLLLFLVPPLYVNSRKQKGEGNDSGKKGKK